jgi:hypothetical protein
VPHALVEGFLLKIKRNRCIAMRFEKLAAHFPLTVTVAAIFVWLAWPAHRLSGVLVQLPPSLVSRASAAAAHAAAYEHAARGSLLCAW